MLGAIKPNPPPKNTMESSFFLTLFIALPAPVKIVLIVVGGFFYAGVKVDHRVEARAIGAAPVPAKPMLVPAQPIPAVPVKPAKGVQPLEIMVNSDGSYQLVGKKLTGPALVKELKAVAAVTPQRRIVIKADALTPYQMVVNAVKLSKSSGLTNVSFASKPAAP
jgi:biopolymer transport protein ExbD|tara:strand:+ start:581 stop:1072 length:492 start_codon:yes stop_codon:yes gene_type:complete